MTSGATKSGDKPTKAGAVELDESELDDIAGGTSWTSTEQPTTMQTADGKYVVNKLIGRPK